MPVGLVHQFKDGVSVDQIDGLIAALGAGIERAPQAGRRTRPYRLTYPPDADPLEFAASLHGDPLVEWADPDRYGEASPQYVPTADYYSYQWYLNSTEYSVGGLPVNINVEVAWEHSTGSGVTVAVFDDGVEMYHTDIAPGFTPSSHDWYDPWYPEGEGFVSGAECQQEDLACVYSPVRVNWLDDHGTYVAGVIAGKGDKIVGVAANAEIVPVRITGGDSIMSDGQLADAFVWADSMGIDVINFSWVWDSATVVTNAINTAASSGHDVVIVASAGNYGEAAPRYPASLSYVLGVGAVGEDGSPASYSNHYPDLVAPAGASASYCGGSIVTTDLFDSDGCSDGPGSNDDYTSTFGGTSAAAAMVSGSVGYCRLDPGGAPFPFSCGGQESHHQQRRHLGTIAPTTWGRAW